MKRIITFCLLLATSFAVNAQGPSKEETIKFINKTLPLAYLSSSQPFEEISITGEQYFERINFDGRNYDQTSNKYHVKWEDISQVTTENPTGRDYIYFNVYFNKECKTDLYYIKNGTITSYLEQTRGMIRLKFPNEEAAKVNSLKKAFEHLAEIFKAENKDPF